MSNEGVTIGFVVIRILIVTSALLVLVYLVAFIKKKLDEKQDKQALTTHQDEWGQEMVNWLDENDIPLNARTTRIMGNLQTWGKEACKRVIQKRVAVGDNVDMVVEAFGKPDSVDQEDAKQNDHEYRWIYGASRRGATYVWFKNDIVTKIET